jgi:hypothetical protein
MMAVPGRGSERATGPGAWGLVETGSRTGLDGLLSAGAAAAAFGLLMALWVALWIPSAPVP